MHDLLVPLYSSNFGKPNEWRHGLIRKPLAAECPQICDMIEAGFGRGWAFEFQRAVLQPTVSAFIAEKSEVSDATQAKRRRPAICGFACYDAAALGVFGPIGILPDYRKEGLGKILLQTTLLDMKAKGYAYAIVAAADPIAFYEQAVGAIPIEGASPGLIGAML